MTATNDMKSWKALEQRALASPLQTKPLEASTLSASNIILDYSTQPIDSQIQTLLIELAEECQLPQKIEDLFLGMHVNITEDKPALHPALRALFQEELLVKNNNVLLDVKLTLEHMRDISNKIRTARWHGYSGKAITDIVNIGIGGSHLGPFFCLQSLTDITLPSLGYHFLSDMDPHAFARLTAKLNPETTLFIVASKSFTTTETLLHLKAARAWMNKPNDFEQHFIAVTAYPEKAKQLGFKHILPIWDWVGGRYSVCSAINLITCIAIGYDAFTALLQGAQSMDEHFRNTPLCQNIPVNLAMLGIWTNNFLKIHHLLLLTYAQNLDHFTAYIQQLDMESNGKSMNHQGEQVCYATGPIIWGGSGNQAQHSYYQLLYQGTPPIVADFISVDAYNDSMMNHLCHAQKDILSTKNHHEKNINGSIFNGAAINHIRLKDISPRSIGALIALYEHKIYVQSVIWQINAFDQPGVEATKQLMKAKLNSVPEY